MKNFRRYNKNRQKRGDGVRGAHYVVQAFGRGNRQSEKRNDFVLIG